jgi:hypothetical protein
MQFFGVRGRHLARDGFWASFVDGMKSDIDRYGSSHTIPGMDGVWKCFGLKMPTGYGIKSRLHNSTHIELGFT